MATDLDFGTLTPNAATTQAVYIREQWGNAWIDVTSQIYCTEATWACAPTMSTATCVHPYGWVRLHGASTWTHEAKATALSFGGSGPDSISRWYIKIAYTIGGDTDSTRYWYGVIGDIDDENRGYITVGANTYASGEETLHCYGLEYLLDREPIASSWYYTGDPDVPAETDAAITFNAGGRGNRCESQILLPGFVPCHIFDGTPEIPTRTYRPKWDDWSTRDIVRYLLVAKVPSASVTHYYPAIAFLPDVYTESLLPADDKPIVQQEGATVWALLCRLIDRRRLRSFCFSIDNTLSESLVWLRVVALNKTGISLPDGRYWRGVDDETLSDTRSPQQINLTCERDALSSVRLRQADTLKADHIIVRGARRTSTATFYFAADRLEAGWTAAQETAYEAGASGEAGYATWDSLKKATTNAEVRAHADLAPVFCWFRIPDGWDLKAGYDVTDRNVFVDDLGNSVDQYIHDVTIQSELMLWENLDYSGTAISGTMAKPRDFVRREPLVVFKRPTDNRYVLGPEMARAAEGECDPATAGSSSRFNCTLRVQPGSRVIEVHVRGEPQHAIAATDFGALAADRDVGAYDYKDKKMLVTLTLEENRYCEGRWPAKGGSHITWIDAQRGHVIFTEREYRQDYLANDTVVDVDDNGTLKVTSAAGYIQDDSTVLQAYARIIYEWYRTTRYALTLSTYRIQDEDSIKLGDMILQFGQTGLGHATSINSTVSEITLSTPRGEGNQRVEPQMRIVTGFGELDILALMPPDPRRR